MKSSKAAIISKLRQDMPTWEGYKPPKSNRRDLLGLGELEQVFPNGVFPLGIVHEMVCGSSEQATSAGGFIAGILSVLMKQGGITVWIGRSGRLFAPAMVSFGVPAHKVIFISLVKDKDALWVMEEALKCSGLASVVCELREMDFKQSRRLQLAVEHSKVTGFVLRNNAEKLGSTACAARWQIKSLPSSDLDGLPGLGYTRWQVELLKVRNGETGKWILEWQQDHFVPVKEVTIKEERQVG